MSATDPTNTANPLDSLPRDVLRCRLDIYEESALLRTFKNGMATVRAVDPADIAAAITADKATSSGLLPEGTLWWSSKPYRGPTYAIWKEAAEYRVALQVEPFQPAERLFLPMPGLLFLCSPGRAPYVFAAKKRPSSPHHTLYKAPTYNVFENGLVCAGTHAFPQDVSDIPEDFFRSFFSRTGDYRERSHRHPEDIIGLWREIDAKADFPMEDLVPQCEVSHAMAMA